MEPLRSSTGTSPRRTVDPQALSTKAASSRLEREKILQVIAFSSLKKFFGYKHPSVKHSDKGPNRALEYLHRVPPILF
jgi:hypothetical protein